MKTNTTIVSNGNKISFKFNAKTAEVRTWLGGDFIGATLMKIEAAREKLARLQSKGWAAL